MLSVGFTHREAPFFETPVISGLINQISPNTHTPLNIVPLGISDTFWPVMVAVFQVQLPLLTAHKLHHCASLPPHPIPPNRDRQHCLTLTFGVCLYYLYTCHSFHLKKSHYISFYQELISILFSLPTFGHLNFRKTFSQKLYTVMVKAVESDCMHA